MKEATAAITGGGPVRLAAAAHLPESGEKPIVFEAEPSACCGGPAPENEDACCLDDAKAKAEGKYGCGCSRE